MLNTATWVTFKDEVRIEEAIEVQKRGPCKPNYGGIQ